MRPLRQGDVAYVKPWHSFCRESWVHQPMARASGRLVIVKDVDRDRRVNFKFAKKKDGDEELLQYDYKPEAFTVLYNRYDRIKTLVFLYTILMLLIIAFIYNIAHVNAT